MTWRIKGWSKFQHFKDRTPPWIKLYRDVLDDPDWHALDGDSAKHLVMLWLIASEDETHNGALPDNRRLAFRLRISEQKVKSLINNLSHWLTQDDISVTSEQYQVDAPEESRDRVETEAQAQDDNFETFWKAYPKKAAKAVALQEWKKAKINGEFDSLLTVLELQKASPDWLQENGKYIPHPAKWIKNKRWQDEIQKPVASVIPKGNYI